MNFSTLVRATKVALAAVVVSGAVVAGMPGVTLAAEALPVAVDDFYTTTVNTKVVTEGMARPRLGVVLPAGVLSNDPGRVANAKETRMINLTDRGAYPTHGTLTWQPNGNFTYQPAAGFVGTDTFSYALYDSLGRKSAYPGRVTITMKLPETSATQCIAAYGAQKTDSCNALFSFASAQADADIARYEAQVQYYQAQVQYYQAQQDMAATSQAEYGAMITDITQKLTALLQSQADIQSRIWS